eukprot:Nitzschia sp. Nitz4//scaffold139_size61406//40510//41157//NITZ4_006461-RA/size61406-snap-gene-0.5-mRNA-1//1//CDS//3329535855//5081//frame0
MATEMEMGDTGRSSHGLLGQIFGSCAEDPKTSVHRAWGISLLFVLFYFVLTIVEMVKLKQNDGSFALMLASMWTGLVHLALGVLGTFVLKRFPTSFSVGFLLGVMVVLANQNLLVFVTFRSYVQGSSMANLAFAGLGLNLFLVYTFLSLMLFHFRQDVVVGATDTKPEEEDAEEPPALS